MGNQHGEWKRKWIQQISSFKRTEKLEKAEQKEEEEEEKAEKAEKLNENKKLKTMQRVKQDIRLLNVMKAHFKRKIKEKKFIRLFYMKKRRSRMMYEQWTNKQKWC